MVDGESGERGPGEVGVSAAAELPGERGDREAEILRAAEAGRAMVAEARRVRRRMLEDAERRRRALVDDLERVRGMLDEAIAALGADGMPGEAASGDPPPGDQEPGDQEPLAREAGPPGDRDDAQVGMLFAQLRAKSPVPLPPRAPAAEAEPPRPAERDTDAAEPEPVAEPELVAEAEPDAEPEPDPEPEDADAEARRRRGAVLEALVPDVVRASKRLLQDEHNTLLDAVRRARGRPEPALLLPDPAQQRDAWSVLLGPGADVAYNGGRLAVGKSRRVASAPARVLAELVGVIVNPLRERLGATIEGVAAEGPYESASELQRAVGAAIGARYREWKTADLETRVVDVLCTAYGRGSYDGVGPATSLRWVPDEPGRCPDCDDNALEPTPKGGVFPTGQAHPPAHPGCRCLVVPAG